MAKGFKDDKGKFRPTASSPRKRATQFFTQNPNLQGSRNPDSKKVDEIKNKKITMKQFIESGNFLEDEVRRRAEKGSPHFFDKDTIRFFSSRVSELMWKKGSDIYFITSEQDRGQTGSVRSFTVRKTDADGDINSIGEFQGHATLSDARSEIKDIIGLGD